MSNWDGDRAGGPAFLELVVKSALVHTATYSVAGILAFNAFGYAEAFTSGHLAQYMRPATDPVITYAPFFQLIRGALFGAVFYLLRASLFTQRSGWLVMWATLAIIGIVNPFAAAPGSIEGLIFTQLTIGEQLGLGLIEVYGQALLLSLGVFYWVRGPHRRLIGIGFTTVTVLFLLATIAGLLLAPSPA